MKSDIQKEPKHYVLKPQTVDEASEEIVQFARKFIADSKEIQRYRILLEEALLCWLEKGLEGSVLTVSVKQKILSYSFYLTVAGDNINPFEESEATSDSYVVTLLSSLGLAPEYSYIRGINTLTFTFKKNANPFVRILQIVGSSILLGFLGNALLSPETISFLLTSLVQPVYETFFDILKCIAGPLVFLSVTWGVYSIGDSTTFGKIGKNMISTYFLIVLSASALGLVALPIFGNTLADTELGVNQLDAIMELILSVIPSDPFSPFINGNTMQILFLAFVSGAILLILDKKTERVARLLEQLNTFMVFCMEILVKILPFFIVLVVLNLMWSNDLGSLSSVWLFLVVLVGVFFVMASAFVIWGAVIEKKSPITIVRNNLPSFLISLTTASSAAAFSQTIHTCVEKYKVKSSLANFSVPLGMVMHNPFAACYNCLLILYFGNVYGLSASPVWLFTTVLVSAVISISTPPIPGGALASYTIMFAQMGIPLDALIVIVAIDVVTDFLITANEMFCLPITVSAIAKRFSLFETSKSDKSKK